MTTRAPTEEIKRQNVSLAKLAALCRSNTVGELSSSAAMRHIAPPNRDETWCGGDPPPQGPIPMHKGSAIADASLGPWHCRPFRQPDRQPAISKAERRAEGYAPAAKAPGQDYLNNQAGLKTAVAPNQSRYCCKSRHAFPTIWAVTKCDGYSGGPANDCLG